MIESMTAYGSVEFEHGTKKVFVELRSVNHRFFDLRVKSPAEIFKFEPDIRKVLKDKLERGSVDCFIKVRSVNDGTSEQPKKLSTDWELLQQYIYELKDIQRQHKIKGNIELPDILKLKDVFVLEEPEAETEGLKEKLIEQLQHCSDSILDMQRKEGSALKDVMTKTLLEIEKNTNTIESKTASLYGQYFEKLKEKIRTLTEGSQVSEDRLVTEAGILAERGDIREEIDRLHSHISQFRHELSNSKGPVGKKLDFIVQEINREINTIASKAEDKETVYLAVENKTLTEQIREQVQNVK